MPQRRRRARRPWRSAAAGPPEPGTPGRTRPCGRTVAGAGVPRRRRGRPVRRRACSDRRRRASPSRWSGRPRRARQHELLERGHPPGAIGCLGEPAASNRAGRSPSRSASGTRRSTSSLAATPNTPLAAPGRNRSPPSHAPAACRTTTPRCPARTAPRPDRRSTRGPCTRRAAGRDDQPRRRRSGTRGGRAAPARAAIGRNQLTVGTSRRGRIPSCGSVAQAPIVTTPIEDPQRGAEATTTSIAIDSCPVSRSSSVRASTRRGRADRALDPPVPGSLPGERPMSGRVHATVTRWATTWTVSAMRAAWDSGGHLDRLPLRLRRPDGHSRRRARRTARRRGGARPRARFSVEPTSPCRRYLDRFANRCRRMTFPTGGRPRVRGHREGRRRDAISSTRGARVGAGDLPDEALQYLLPVAGTASPTRSPRSRSSSSVRSSRAGRGSRRSPTGSTSGSASTTGRRRR